MNLITVAIIAILLWAGAFAFYLYTSKQHNQIERDLERVRKLVLEREKAS